MNAPEAGQAPLIVARSFLAPGLMAVGFASSFSVALAAPQPQPAVREAGIRQLERS
jgi:hypothetical protein